MGKDFKTYKKDIVLSYLEKYPNASTQALSRIIFKENPLDFTSVEGVRGSVRKYRGENGKNNSPFTTEFYRDEKTKKQFMKKTFDLPESDYEKTEPFTFLKDKITY